MREFERLWLAQTVSLFGDMVAIFAVQAAIVFRMHGGAQEAAGVLISSLVPAALLGPLAGVFVDRKDPRHVMIASDLVRAVLVLSLAAATSAVQIYAISFAVSCLSSFFSPAQVATIPLLLKREQLLSANVRMQQTAQVIRIISPPLASALVTRFGEATCYVADSLSFLVSAALIWTISLPASRSARTAVSSRGPQTSWPASFVFADFKKGVHFLFTEPKFSFVTWVMAAGAFATGCFGALVSVFIRDVLRANQGVYAQIGSLIAMGTVAGAFVARRIAARYDCAGVMGGGMSAIGLAILVMSLVPRVAISLCGAFTAGGGIALVMAASMTMLQGQTPPDMRGRVSSALASCMALAQLAAMFVAAKAAPAVGVRGVFGFCAVTLLAIGACALSRTLTTRGRLLEQEG